MAIGMHRFMDFVRFRSAEKPEAFYKDEKREFPGSNKRPRLTEMEEENKIQPSPHSAMPPVSITGRRTKSISFHKMNGRIVPVFFVNPVIISVKI